MSLAIPQKAKLRKKLTAKHFFYTVWKNIVQYLQFHIHLHQKSNRKPGVYLKHLKKKHKNVGLMRLKRLLLRNYVLIFKVTFCMFMAFNLHFYKSKLIQKLFRYFGYWLWSRYFTERIIFQHFFPECIWLSPYALRVTSGNLLFTGKKVFCQIYNYPINLLVKYATNFIKKKP